MRQQMKDQADTTDEIINEVLHNGLQQLSRKFIGIREDLQKIKQDAIQAVTDPVLRKRREQAAQNLKPTTKRNKACGWPKGAHASSRINWGGTGSISYPQTAAPPFHRRLKSRCHPLLTTSPDDLRPPQPRRQHRHTRWAARKPLG